MASTTSRRQHHGTRTERAIWTVLSLSVIALLLAALLLLVEALDRVRAEIAPATAQPALRAAPRDIGPQAAGTLDLCAPPAVRPPLRARVQLASRTAQGL